MAFCSSCGGDVGTASFCPKCGAAQGAAPATGGGGSAAVPATEGMAENVAGVLCYVLGWVTGIIFLLIDRRPYVKFQAAQSIVVFGGLTILRIGLGVLTGFVGLFGWGLWAVVWMPIGLAGLILWVLLMVKAYQHENFRVPIAADIADGIAGK
jgi:uncharacterized membrane protein